MHRRRGDFILSCLHSHSHYQDPQSFYETSLRGSQRARRAPALLDREGSVRPGLPDATACSSAKRENTATCPEETCVRAGLRVRCSISRWPLLMAGSPSAGTSLLRPSVSSHLFPSDVKRPLLRLDRLALSFGADGWRESGLLAMLPKG